MQAMSLGSDWRHGEPAEMGARRCSPALRAPDRDQTQGRPQRSAAAVPLERPLLAINIRTIDRGWSARTKWGLTSRRTSWHQVILTWLMAASFLSVIPLLPEHGRQSHDPAWTGLAQVAGAIAHPSRSESEGHDDTCPGRDYANERC